MKELSQYLYNHYLCAKNSEVSSDELLCRWVERQSGTIITVRQAGILRKNFNLISENKVKLLSYHTP